MISKKTMLYSLLFVVLTAPVASYSMQEPMQINEQGEPVDASSDSAKQNLKFSRSQSQSTPQLSFGSFFSKHWGKIGFGTLLAGYCAWDRDAVPHAAQWTKDHFISLPALYKVAVGTAGFIGVNKAYNYFTNKDSFVKQSELEACKLAAQANFTTIRNTFKAMIDLENEENNSNEAYEWLKESELSIRY